jgi:hypothetical protein
LYKKRERKTENERKNRVYFFAIYREKNELLPPKNKKIK